MRCVALPTGRELELAPGDGSAAVIARAVEHAFDLQDGAVAVMQKSCAGKLVSVGHVDAESTVFALIRCRAGGKGGFKKQLEKKGREFARAQRAEERAKRHSSSQAKKSDKGNKDKKETQQVTPTAARESKDFVASMTTNSNACRLLAKQGVTLAIAKVLQNSGPSS